MTDFNFMSEPEKILEFGIKRDNDWYNPKEILENFKIRNAKTGGTGHWIYYLKKAVNRAIELGYDKMSKKFINQ